MKPSLHNLLLGNGVTGHLYIRRIPMADVPADEETATKWMHELYQRKVRGLKCYVIVNDEILMVGNFNDFPGPYAG